jgi:formylmethanofuran dehydrogenase subunit E
MKLLRFPPQQAEAAVSARFTQRLRTRCESCGEPTVEQACLERDSVCLQCYSCEHVWLVAERRQSAREA